MVTKVLSPNYNELQGILQAAHTAMREQHEKYQSVMQKMNGDMAALQADRRQLAGRARILEDQVTGLREGQMAWQAQMKNVQDERGVLKEAVVKYCETSHRLTAELEIVQREQAQNLATIEEQRERLETFAKRTATEDCLQKELEKRAILQAELSTAQMAKQNEQTNLSTLTACVAGGVFALATGGFGGLLLGLGAGKFAGNAITENPVVPCMTPHFARLDSIQTRLNLVNQEIARLKKLLA